jgi:hypothetical protein
MGVVVGELPSSFFGFGIGVPEGTDRARSGPWPGRRYQVGTAAASRTRSLRSVSVPSQAVRNVAADAG